MFLSDVLSGKTGTLKRKIKSVKLFEYSDSSKKHHVKNVYSGSLHILTNNKYMEYIKYNMNDFSICDIRVIE